MLDWWHHKLHWRLSHGGGAHLFGWRRRKRTDFPESYAVFLVELSLLLEDALGSYLLLVGTGIGLLLGDNRALNGLAFAIVLLLVNGIRNAWDMIVWITIKTESPPQ